MTTIRDLTPGKNYLIQFRARRGDDISPWSDTKELAVSEDILAPAEVTNIVATAIKDNFKVTWDAPTLNSDGTPLQDFKDYAVRVQQIGGDEQVEFFFTQNTHFEFTIDLNRVTFGVPRPSLGFSVVARDNANNAVAFPPNVIVQNVAPGPPTNLITQNITDGVALKWTPSPDSDVVGYSIYVSGSLFDRTPNTSFVYNSTSYTSVNFSIRAYDTFNLESLALNGSGQPQSAGTDTTPPDDPTWATTWFESTTTYENRLPVVRAKFTWDANTESDLSGYIFRYRLQGDTAWTESFTTSTSQTVDRLQLDKTYELGLAAIDRSGNRSAFVSAPGTYLTVKDTTPTEVPSTPTLSSRLGNLHVSWDGEDEFAAAMPFDFSHVEVHVSQSNGFTPSDLTLVDRIYNGAGKTIIADLPYNSTIYVKLVAVDTSGNQSDPSGQASEVITPLVNTDIIGEIVSGANIVDGSIVASDKVVANSITATEIAAEGIEAGNIAANAVTADKIAAGSISTDKIAIGSIRSDRLSTGVGVNLVHDPSFEDPDYWMARAYDTSQAIYSNAPNPLCEFLSSVDAHSGERVVRINYGTASSNFNFVLVGSNTTDVTKFRTITGRTRVYASAWSRTVNAAVSTVGQPGGLPRSDTRIRLVVEFYDSAATVLDTIVHQPVSDGTNHDWTKMEVDTVAPQAATHYRAWVSVQNYYIESYPEAGNNGDNRYYIDSVNVMETIGGTGSNGQSIDLSPKGVRLFDNEGAEVISLTSEPPNYVSINEIGAEGELVTLASISETGDISGRDAYFETVSSLDLPILDAAYLARNENVSYAEQANFNSAMAGLPWGTIAWGRPTANSGLCSQTAEVGWFRVSATLHSGRQYRITCTSCVAARDSGITANVPAKIRYTVGSTMPTVSSEILNTVPGANRESTPSVAIPSNSALYHVATATPGSAQVNFLVTIGPIIGGDSATRYYGQVNTSSKIWPELYIEDIGPYKSSAAVHSTGGGGAGTYVPPDTNDKTTYTKTYYFNWSGTYDSSNSYMSNKGSEVHQGYYSASTGGNRRGLYGFNTTTWNQIQSDLSGATIKGCWFYTYFDHWYNNSGGTAIIGTSGHSGSRPSTLTSTNSNRVQSSSWPKPGGRKVSLGTTIGNDFKSGSARAILLGPGPSTSLVYYGRARAYNTSGSKPYLQISYEK